MANYFPPKSLKVIKPFWICLLKYQSIFHLSGYFSSHVKIFSFLTMSVKVSAKAFYYFGVSTHFRWQWRNSLRCDSRRHPLKCVIDCIKLVDGVDGCSYSSPGFFSRRDDLSCRQQEAEEAGVPQLQGEGVLNAQPVVGPVRAPSRG